MHIYISYSKIINNSDLWSIKMAKKSHHVVHNKLSGWDVKKGGGVKSIKHFEKKQEAVNFARQI